jgi:hypothetical protein
MKIERKVHPSNVGFTQKYLHGSHASLLCKISDQKVATSLLQANVVVFYFSLEYCECKGTLAETKIGRLVYASGRSGGTVVTIILLFNFIMILLTVRLPTHLEQTKSVCAIIYLYIKKYIMLETVTEANKIITFEGSVRFIT